VDQPLEFAGSAGPVIEIFPTETNWKSFTRDIQSIS
jgi:hypothetical protein